MPRAVLELAAAVGRRLHWIHTFIVGASYQANDPANLLWVHATLADTALRCYEDLVEPLSPADAETYYQEMARVAEVFGVDRSEQPATLAEFRQYVDDTVAAMEVTEVGKDLATFILDPTLPLGLHVPLQPLLNLQKLLTLGSLPAPIRDQLGQRWGASEQARYERTQRRARRVFGAVPRPLRTAANRLGGVGLLWMAQRHIDQFESKHPEVQTEKEMVTS